MASQKLNFRL